MSYDEQEIPDEPLAIIIEDESGLDTAIGSIKVRRQGEWLYVTVGSTEVMGRRGPTGIDIIQVSQTYKQDEFQEAVDTIEKMLGKGGAETIAESNPGIITVQCPLCYKTIEIPLYDSVDRSDALIDHLKKEHKGE